jgi:hypothetical protein
LKIFKTCGVPSPTKLLPLNVSWNIYKQNSGWWTAGMERVISANLCEIEFEP